MGDFPAVLISLAQFWDCHMWVPPSYEKTHEDYSNSYIPDLSTLPVIVIVIVIL